ncbi:MAG: GNAT family N-acetyltransferase [Candidatus Aegiribacteria sp.]|nr:GNAT family N-acetyltransferase [Candidatus Aegiribacteria sp.]
MNNVTFRPFSVARDRDMLCAFLRDTKKSVGDMVEDHAADCKHYIKAVLSTQKRDSAFCVVVCEDNSTIGFVDIFPMKSKPGVGFMRFIYLIPECRGRSYGKLLLDYAVSVLKEYDCRAIILDVSRNNSKAIRFYENHGWVFTGKEHGCHLQMKIEIQFF